MKHLSLIVISCLLAVVQSHPVWDVSYIVNNITENSEIDPELLEPDDPRGILDYIDNIISGRMVISCATKQGQKGRCAIGSCPTLGEMPATKCPGRFASFLKCCPTEKASEILPPKVPGKYYSYCNNLLSK